jgi:uncharacterized protein YidB (DUF937 family)
MLPRSLKFYLGVLGALLAAGFVVTVTAAASGVRAVPFAAASPKPSASPGAAARSQAYCDKFIDHLASNLGKKPADVQKAASSAVDQTLEDAVKAGDLTRQQADAIKARQAGKSVCSGALAGLRPERGEARARVALADYAKALGISPQELKQQLAAGKTIKDIATAKGMDENTFRNNLVTAAKADLDAKVTAGKLTQQQEDGILNKLKTGPLPLWDKPAKRAKAVPSPTS